LIFELKTPHRKHSFKIVYVCYFKLSLPSQKIHFLRSGCGGLGEIATAVGAGTFADGNFLSSVLKLALSGFIFALDFPHKICNHGFMAAAADYAPLVLIFSYERSIHEKKIVACGLCSVFVDCANGYWLLVRSSFYNNLGSRVD
jgi:hypothetical protein